MPTSQQMMQVLQPAVETSNIMANVKMLWGPASVGQFAPQGAALTDTFLSNSSNQVGNTFVLPSDGTIDQVGFLISNKTGTPPAYNVGIVTLDSNGLPTTSAYGGSAITSYTPTSTGWKWVTLSTPATANAGDVCAVVIYAGVSAPDASNYIKVVHSNLATPGAGGNYSFGAWALATMSTAMAVHYDTGVVYGYALSSANPAVTITTGTTPDEVGDKFTLPVNMTCFGGRFIVYNSGFGASATFDLVLYDSGDNVVASGSISDKDYVSRNIYIDVYWDPVVLTRTETYRLVVKPTAAQNVVIQRCSMDSTDAMLMWPCGDTWQGTSRTDAGAWTDVSTDMVYMALWVSAMEFTSAYAYSG